ncbi:MAG: [Ni/Fe] hydrogenase, large subunit [Bacteroidetes bacterium]|jgi:hydrogenase large subunit|nr:[Ni/Fe] hydrogenase, large subunit [Bacteroidota bacterium]
METIRKTIVIDPLTRIEGHLKIEADVENKKVVDARVEGTLYRGFEQILVGRNPVDAIQITQRFCGVCPTPHAIASTQALENAFGIMPPNNGRIIRNIMQAANYVQSHVLHFYHLSSLDYFRGPDVPPFVPRYESDYRVPKSVHEALIQHYIQAYQMRLKAHELSAIWSGKMPHVASIVPGGVSVVPRIDNITTSLWRLKELTEFINNVYLPDVITLGEVYRDYFSIGVGPKNYLSFGLFDLDAEPDVTKRKRFFPMGRITNGKLESVDPQAIVEDVRSSWYSSSSHLHPSKGETVPKLEKKGAYSWLKSPRYDGKVYEVGPLARVAMMMQNGAHPAGKELVEKTLRGLQLESSALSSVMGRHLARAIECKLVADSLGEMIMQVKLEEPVCVPHTIPEKGQGMGLWCAARGALGHWVEIQNGKIARYQAVVPTTWNASPRDDRGLAGPIEQALIGTTVEDTENPFPLARIVRSFDPCIACAVHILEPGKAVKKFRIL